MTAQIDGRPTPVGITSVSLHSLTKPGALLLVAFFVSGCASILPPIARLEKGTPTFHDYPKGERKPLILVQSQDHVSVEIHAWTDKKNGKWFFGSNRLADNYLPVFIEIRNLRDESISLDPTRTTLEDNQSAFNPVVPFRISDRLKKDILEGKRYEGHSFDPDRGVSNVEGSAAYAAPVAFAALAWLVGGAAYVVSANTWSFMDMGGTEGVIVSNCFPKCLGKGDRLNPNEFLSPVRLAPSGRVSGFLYFPHPASSGKVNVVIGTEGGAPVKPFSFSLNDRCP